jgi:tetratricopeptide (TPR) repeat protein
VKESNYRVKLSSGRVIGPISKNDFKDLYFKKVISGKEDIQEFPVGKWCRFAFFEEIVEIISKAIESTGESPVEFIEIVKNSGVIETSEDFNSTVIHKLNDEDFEDKTKINPDYQKYLIELKKNAEKKKKLENENLKRKQEEIVIVEAEPDYENEATQMLNMRDLQKSLEVAVTQDEKQQEQVKKIKKQNRKKKLESEEFESEADIKPSIDIKKLILGLIFVVLAYTVIFEEDKKKIELQPIITIDPQITFNSRYDIEDEKKSKILLKKGIIEINKGSYKHTLKATKFFIESLKEKFNNNTAAAWLIFSYSNILHNSKNFNKDANTIFKLVKNFRSMKLKDPHFASAIAYFYLKIGKLEAADSLLKKYRLIPTNKSTIRLFTVYLDVLTHKGDYVEAVDYASKLATTANKNLFTLTTLYKYYQSQGSLQKQIELITEASNKYPNSVYFLLERGNLFLREGDLKQVKKIILKINKLNAESSRYFHSRYLALKGLYTAALGKLKVAIKDIKKSLSLYANNELLEKLSELSTSDNEDANALIVRAKSDKIVKIANTYYQKKEYNDAFKYALNSLEVDPSNVAASLLLARLQLKKGYLDDAIEQLEELDKGVLHRSIKDYKGSLDIKFMLVRAYTDAFKIKEANRVLMLINKMITKTKRSTNSVEIQMFVNDDRYYAAKAKLFRAKGDFTSSLLWLNKAKKQNPLNEENIYNFVNIFIHNNEFTKAKHYLNQVMDLNPVNVEYRITNAKILYEVESLDTAVGYLYDVLEEFPDNPKIYSAIGIYYYRSGKVKNYETIKRKLLSLPEKDISLYEFLLESARLDEDFESIIKNSIEIIQRDPGNLVRRLYLAEVLIELKRYGQAMKELKQIELRYQSYPRLKYFIAKLHFLSGSLDKALEFAKIEVKTNPGVVDGYLILGNIYVEKKEYSIARDNYLEVARIQPDNVDAILGIALIAAVNNQFDMAVDQYTKAIKLDPNRAEIYRLIGNTYRKIEQTQLAIKNYKQFLELSPKSSYKRELEAYIRKLE